MYIKIYKLKLIQMNYNQNESSAIYRHEIEWNGKITNYE